MPTFESFAAFEREIARFQNEFEKAHKRRITKAQAEAGIDIATGMFKGVLGGDNRFSGWPPELDLKFRELRDGATLLTPTKPGAGPTTVVFKGRNQGETGLLAGPGINQRTGGTFRTKTNAVRKTRARKARKWNGTTDPKLDPETVRAAIEKAAFEIADREYRRALQRRFDVD